MTRIAVLAGIICMCWGIFLCFDGFNGYLNGGLLWDFISIQGLGLIAFGLIIFRVNWSILREETK